MGLNNTITLSKFSTGLITDLEEAEIPITAASRLENADIRNDKLETQPGVLEVNTGLSASFIKLYEEQFKFTIPSEQNCVLVHGTLSGAHKLYIRPYLSLAGAWVDSWQELTEKEGNYTSDAGTNTTQIVDNELLSTTTDYYKGWMVYNSIHTGSAIVTAYNGSTKTLTLSWAIGSQTSGDTYFIVRNPIYDIQGNYLFAPSASGCRFLQRANAIDIVTGGDVAYDSSASPYKSDLWLGVLNGYQAFDDTDLNFTGFYLTRKHLAPLHPNIQTLSAQTLSAGEQELPVPSTSYYVVLPVAVYDGFQEGPIFEGSVSPYDGTAYGTSNEAIIFTTASRKLQIALSVYYGFSGVNWTPQLLPNASGSDDTVYRFVIFDRRITAIRIYVAEGAAISSNIRPNSEFRFVQEVKINDSTWSGAGANYTQTVYITGDKWDAAAGIDISDRQGHSSLKVHANADFIATGKKSVAVANTFTDERRQSFVFFSATNSDEINTPSTFPHTSFADLSSKGIPKILAFIEASGNYVAIGENKLVGIDGETLGVDNDVQTYGTSSRNSAKNVNQLIYFASLENCYYYHPFQKVVRELMTGFVRTAWKALSSSDKQAAAIGYDGNLNVLVIAAGTTIYIYNLPAAYASDLAQDTQAVGSWSIYNVSKTFLRFYTNLSKQCIGIASDGKSYELFSSGVANTMIYESPVVQGPLDVEAVGMTYNATSAPTVKIFDVADSETYPVRTLTFRTQSTHKLVTQYKGAKTERFKLQVSAPVGTVISKIEINPQQIDPN